MARTSGFRQLDRAQLSPFARMIYDYMLSAQPYPKLVSELAEESGVSNNAIWSWLKHGVIPRRSTIVPFAARTGLDVDALLRAAGMPDSHVSDIERRGAARVARIVTKRVEQLIQEEGIGTPEGARRFLDALRSREGLMVEAILTAQAKDEEIDVALRDGHEGHNPSDQGGQKRDSRDHRARRPAITNGPR